VCAGGINTTRTIFLVIIKLVKMAVSRVCPVDIKPVCQPGEQRAWKSGQRVQYEAIADYACDDLSNKSVSGRFVVLLLRLTKPNVATHVSNVSGQMVCKSRRRVIVLSISCNRCDKLSLEGTQKYSWRAAFPWSRLIYCST
jgi:hypothetical protein